MFIIGYVRSWRLVPNTDKSMDDGDGDGDGDEGAVIGEACWALGLDRDEDGEVRGWVAHICFSVLSR